MGYFRVQSCLLGFARSFIRGEKHGCLPTPPSVLLLQLKKKEIGASIFLLPELNMIQKSNPKILICSRLAKVTQNHQFKGFLRPFQPALVVCSSSIMRVERRGFSGVPLQGMRTKDFGALTSKLSELKNVPRPYPNLMFPSAYVPRGGLPVYEVVSRYQPIQLGPMVYDLRIDVWPNPFCWMLHGIWPAYVSGHWLVHYKLEDLDWSELYLMKDKVKREILKLDFNTKEILHEIWQSYGNFYEDPREQDMEFWAYQKVVHCWDLLNCPPGQYFYVMAKLGKYVRDTLLNWTMKSTYTPNQFYTSAAIRQQMEWLFGVAVYLIVKADDDTVYDPASTGIPFLYSLGFMIVKDPMQMYSYYFCDHPSGLTKVPHGSLFLLM